MPEGRGLAGRGGSGSGGSPALCVGSLTSLQHVHARSIYIAPALGESLWGPPKFQPQSVWMVPNMLGVGALAGPSRGGEQGVNKLPFFVVASPASYLATFLMGMPGGCGWEGGQGG